MLQSFTDSLIVAFGLAIIGLMVAVSHFLSGKIDSLGKKIEEIPDKFWNKFIDAYMLLERMRKSNPGHEERKLMLLEKLKARTISREEAIELSEMLKKEAEEKEKQRDFFGLLLVIGILILLLSLISKEQK